MGPTDAGTGSPPVLNPGLTLAVRGAMYAVAALSIASMLSTLNELSAFDALAARTGAVTAADLASAEQLSETFVNLAFWVGVAAGGATIVWWFRAFQAILATGASGLRWSAKWAVGGWFVPLGNAIIPKLVLNEIDRVSRAGPHRLEEWRAERLTPVANWWWATWVGGIAVALLGATIVSAETVAASFDAGSYRVGLMVTATGFAMSVAAGFLGAATIRLIGERLHPRP